MKKGTRVQLHAATSYWMQGDRYGTVLGMGLPREYVDRYDGTRSMVAPVRVKLDKSKRTVTLHPSNLFEIVD